MKYLFVGDIHNHNYIFDDIQKLDFNYNFDRIIFFGDYVDDWMTDNHDSLITLEKVFELKDNNPEKYTLLIGNHELSYLGYPCSGHKKDLDDVVEQKLKENIDKLDFYTSVLCGNNEYICTHAGITNQFIIGQLNGEKLWRKTLNEFDKDKLNYLDKLSICGKSRGGLAPYSSFVWNDARDLCACCDPIIPYQIAGHTPVPVIYMEVGDNYNYIFIDTHSTYPDCRPYGDCTYLIWNDNKFDIEK